MPLKISILIEFYIGIVCAVSLPQHGFLAADCSESSVKSDK